MEVPARHNVTVRCEHDWIVDHRSQLDLEHGSCVLDRVANRPVDLRRTAQAVGVLDLVSKVIMVRRINLGPLQQCMDPRG